MQLPTLHLPHGRRAYITGRHLMQAAKGKPGETFLYQQEQGLGVMLASVTDGFAMLSCRVAYGDNADDAHVTIARGAKKPKSLCCPKCGREARKLYLAPISCALCYRIGERVRKFVIEAVGKQPTPEEIAERHRKEAERWKSLSHDERIQELEARLAVEKWIRDNEE